MVSGVPVSAGLASGYQSSMLVARIRETRGGRGQSGERIARCQALLDQGLDDADVRMELWFESLVLLGLDLSAHVPAGTEQVVHVDVHIPGPHQHEQ